MAALTCSTPGCGAVRDTPNGPCWDGHDYDPDAELFNAVPEPPPPTAGQEADYQPALGPPRLEILLGAVRCEVPIDQPVLLGRSSESPTAELFAGHLKVSRRHLRVSVDGGEFVIEDLGSTNGTFVLASRADKPTTVPDRSEVSLSRSCTVRLSLIISGRRRYEA